MKWPRIVLIVTVFLLVVVLLWALGVPWEPVGNKVATVSGSLAGIAGVGVALWAYLRSRRGASRGEAAPGAEDRRSLDQTISGLRRLLATASQVSVSSQLKRLTNRGTLLVPWTLVSGTAGPRRKSARPSDHHEVQALIEVLSLNSSRMIIVGKSDSGKTTMLHLLAAALLRNPLAVSGQVPVVISLASWRPLKVGFYIWAARQFANNFPHIGAEYNTDELVNLLESGTVITLLDGFDEIEKGCQVDAWEALQSVAKEIPMVVASRNIGIGENIWFPPIATNSALVTLDLLPLAEVADYLRVDERAGGESVWGATMAEIQMGSPDGILAESLSSPLMAWLAGTVYAPATGSRSDASELIDSVSFPNREAIEDHLLRSLVSSVFRRKALDGRQSGVVSFDYRQAERWLGFLANAIQRDGEPIAFWNLKRAAPMRRIGLLLAILSGVVLGVFYVWSPIAVLCLITGYALGLFFGFGFGRGYSMSRSGGLRDPNRSGFGGGKPGTDLDFRAHLGIFLFGAAFGLLGIISAVVVARLRQGAWPALPNEFVTVGMMVSTIVAIVVTSIGAFIGGTVAAAVLRSSTNLEALTGAQAQTPVEVVTNDRRSGIGMIALSWLFVSAVVTLVLLVTSEHSLAFALLAGLGAVPSATAIFNIWITYKTAHLWLVVTNRLPWQLPEFLDQAHRNGVLKQSGISYEFRHARLRKTLADTL